MSRASILILLGLLTIFTQFSGIPSATRVFLTVIFGACVFGIGIALRTREINRAKPPQVEPTSTNTSGTM